MKEYTPLPGGSRYYEWQGLKDIKGPGAWGEYVLRVVRPEGISRDQGPAVSMYYQWRGLKGYQGTRGLGYVRITSGEA